MIDKQNEDLILRDLINSSASTYQVPPDDTTKYRYWMDGDLKIRTCLECAASDFQSPIDGMWIVYATQESFLYICYYYLKNGEWPKPCKACSYLGGLK